ncbi:MAG: SUF system Fe-S cluster assembly regulator [Myxococcaceae bacterium]|nr:SUF system Fe-S cluster assembly regulator [Myxococcaceae bacterium]MCI0673597.1 SUF system Fe-S cluster assembly regulator [Myxococcaceae bacterium]
MFRMSRMTDYGVVLLATLAREEGATLPARTLALRTGLPLPTVSKLLKALSQAGLLVSHRGVRGGYSLVRPAEALSVAEVLAVLEGPLTLTACGLSPQGACALEPVCPVREPWHQLSRKMLETLAHLTLADLARPSSSRSAAASPLAALEVSP